MTTQEEPAWERELWRKVAAPPKQRAEIVLEQITKLAASRPSGHRLGSKEELRVKSNVSVGTFNEALRLLQSRGIVAVRRGPGGGVFVAEQSVLTKLRNDVISPDGPPPNPVEVDSIAQALTPLLVADATRSGTAEDGRELRERLAALTQAADRRQAEHMHEASVELYVAMIGICSGRTLRSFMKIIVEMYLERLSHETPFVPADSVLRAFLDDVTNLVEAMATHDLARARSAVNTGNPFQFFTRVESAPDS
jgi:DNA-binding FadR family transcriptional regulator